MEYISVISGYMIPGLARKLVNSNAVVLDWKAKRYLTVYLTIYLTVTVVQATNIWCLKGPPKLVKIILYEN